MVLMSDKKREILSILHDEIKDMHERNNHLEIRIQQITEEIQKNVIRITEINEIITCLAGIDYMKNGGKI